MNNFILEYYQKIMDGSEIAGQWIILAYDMIVRSLQDKVYYYDPKKAQAISVAIARPPRMRLTKV